MFLGVDVFFNYTANLLCDRAEMKSVTPITFFAGQTRFLDVIERAFR
jgi:hypothetical protein